jgi:TRAP-type C4-dicarboxylate transport system permease small subunit
VKATARRLLEALHRFEDVLLAVLLSALVILAAAQIFLRISFDEALSFADPVARALVLWVGLLGALAATREGKHISLDVLSARLSGGWKRAAQALSALVGMVVCAVLGWYSLELVALEREAASFWIEGVPSWVPQLILPVAFFAMALRFGLLALLGVEEEK